MSIVADIAEPLWLRGTSDPLAGAPPQTVRFYEDSVAALARLDELAAMAPPVVRRLLLARHASGACGAGAAGFRSLILIARRQRAGSVADAGRTAEHRFLAVLEDATDRLAGGRALTAEGLRELAASAGLHVDGADALHALDPLLRAAASRTPAVLKAALVAGAVVTLVSGESGAPLAALAAALGLASGGATGGPWVAPVRLDAAARAAVVQLERYGSWAAWIRAWCQLLAAESQAVAAGLREVRARSEEDRSRARALRKVGTTVTAVLGHLQAEGAIGIPDGASALGLTRPTIAASLDKLEGLELAAELTGRGRDRVWAYRPYVEAFGPS
jgi:hypothetical protein